jgi:hypothetical protein
MLQKLKQQVLPEHLYPPTSTCSVIAKETKPLLSLNLIYMFLNIHLQDSTDVCTVTCIRTRTYTHLLQWLDKISCLEVTSCCLSVMYAVTKATLWAKLFFGL